MDAQAFINHVNEAGGVCVSCHPFRNNNRGLEENLRAVKGLHGVEVLNGSTALEANRRAFTYCRELGLKTIEMCIRDSGKTGHRGRVADTGAVIHVVGAKGSAHHFLEHEIVLVGCS